MNHASAMVFLLQEYFVFAGTYTDTVVITRDNVRVYGQTNIPDSYRGNSKYHPLKPVSEYPEQT